MGRLITKRRACGQATLLVAGLDSDSKAACRLFGTRLDAWVKFAVTGPSYRS